MFGIGEGAILVIVVILLLGARKIPDLARSAGQSMRILKSEAKALKREGKDSGDSPPPPPAPVRPGRPEDHGHDGAEHR
ncbi:twin-arginine translocase TatA/TatE family subunit [Streptomyces sp. NPDC048172]|uniref:twin-arginine translocase TatA/TatE family subunit n=1 Tax=Streptomyces sp. NPDC048172 TaxID=3365505 RepID=UPI0037126C4C